MPSSGLLEGLTICAENTGLVVGRTLVDPSQWKVPVLVSNFSQDTVMVEPFSETWSHRCPPYRQLRRPQTGLRAAVSHFPCTFVTFWVRRPGTWMRFNSANWRVSFFVMHLFYVRRDSLIHAPILAFPTETGQYILDTDASNFGLGGVLSQIQGDVECVVAYCSRALRPSQRWYCTTKREILAGVAMCIQFWSYLRCVKFTLRMDHKSLVCLHPFKDTEGMMARWLHALQQFQFSIVHRPGRDHGNADGLSRVPSSPCRQCT